MQPFIETIQPPTNASFVLRRWIRPSFPFDWHIHPEIELTLILRGHGRRFVGDSIETFQPGDLVLIGSNLPHTWHSQDAQPTQGVEAVVAQFPESLLNLPELHHARQLVARAAVGLHFPALPPSHVMETFSSLPEAGSLDRLVGLLQILQMLAKLDTAQPLATHPHPVRFLPEDRTRIDAICRNIARQCHHPIHQADVARDAGMTPAAFSRFFRKTTGRTFTDHVHHLRVGEVCRLLIETDAPITTIAFQCGFENLANFNRIFRRLKQTSPRQFRAAFRFAR